MKKRPVNLDLATLSFPPMAIASILHRISGVLLFLLLPFMLYLLDLSLRDPTTFTDLHLYMVNPYCKLCIWMFSSAALYHALAGIRHLFMDAGFGESLIAGRRSSVLLLIVATAAIFALGIWIW